MAAGRSENVWGFADRDPSPHSPTSNLAKPSSRSLAEDHVLWRKFEESSKQDKQMLRLAQFL